MTKKELVVAVAVQSGTTKKAAAQAVETTLAVISETLASGEAVQLLGFGTFTIKERAARRGINPSTKAPLDIPAKKAIVFRPSKAKM